MFNKLLKLATGFIFAISAASPAMAGGEAEVLHWWTSGAKQKHCRSSRMILPKKVGLGKTCPLQVVVEMPQMLLSSPE